MDQALEQENKRLKVIGGLKGITKKQAAIQRFFLIAHELDLERLSSEAEKMAGFSPEIRITHHKMSKRIQDRQEVTLAMTSSKNALLEKHICGIKSPS